MTDYVKSTNFTSKDSLPSGNALKIIKGTEFDTEFNNIATAISTKAESSALAAKADASSVSAALDLKAPLASPALTGTPTAPTAAVNTSTTQVATTAFVVAQIADDAPTKTGTGATGTWGIDITGNAATATTATSATTASTVTTITTDQVLNATAGAAIGTVGTYAFLFDNTINAINTAGSTKAGSSLRYAGIGSDTDITAVTAVYNGTPSGTWRCMGYSARSPAAANGYGATLWLRIS